MKLIQINSTLKSGSTGRIAYQLHNELDVHGIQNSIVFGIGDKNDKVGFSMHSKLGMHLHSFLSRKLCCQGLVSVGQTLRLVSYLKREMPDVVHLHNIHGHYLNYPILFWFLKRWNRPVIWTFHDCWPYTGKCAHYFNVSCDKWKTQCTNCPNLSTYPDSTFDGSASNFRLKKKCFCSIPELHVVCNSKWLEGQVKESFFKDKMIHQIYNGVDTSIFYPRTQDTGRIRAKYSIPAGQFVMLGVSSVWKKDKGLDTFLTVAAQLGEKGVAVIVGVTRAQKEQLPPYVIGIIHTENADELAQLYSTADVLLNPSMIETFGMVAAEAMACGTPAIVADTTACPETVISGTTGYVVDMMNMKAIADAVEMVRTRGKQTYTSACISHIQKNLSLERMCDLYCDLYMQVVYGMNEENMNRGVP